MTRHGASAWLTARPIAHRGLHDRTAGVIENSASAFEAAVAGRYAIECDVRISADGEAMVIHDDRLDRLTERTGPIDAWRAADLEGVVLRGSDDTIMTLRAMLDLVAGRVATVCEIKSRFEGDRRLAERVAAVARAYAGPLAIKSFDPAILAHLADRRDRLGLADRPLGLVGEEASAGVASRTRLRDLGAGVDFLSWNVRDLPGRDPADSPGNVGVPILAWTVRSRDAADAAYRRADQIVFEGFRP